MIDDDQTEWRSMESAPQTGEPMRLRFPGGYGNVRGSEPRRIDLPDRETVGRWWSAEDAYRKLGKRSRKGMRGHRIARDGGFWGGVKKSKPCAGMPREWSPIA